MKILFIAFSCNPYKGSESFCGWSWIASSMKTCDTWVITRSENKVDIEQYIYKNGLGNERLHFVYLDIPAFLNFYYKTRKLYMLYYIIWLKTIAKKVIYLHSRENFDVIHHVTLGDFRNILPLGTIACKKVFGPVGGAQLTPKVFSPYINSPKRRFSEKFREVVNRLICRSRRYQKILNDYDLILAANCETEECLKKYLCSPGKCVLMSENGIHRNEIQSYKDHVKTDNDEINIIWSGRMVYRKGLDLLLDVLAELKTERKYVVTLVGTGPELKRLKKKSRAMQLSMVHFAERVPYNQMKEIYKMADIFVFPSLRETTGTVLLEAISNGIPVVCFDQNGAQVVLTQECAEFVTISKSLASIQKEFREKLKKLIENDEYRVKKSRNAYIHACTDCTWDNKFERYLTLLGE